MFVCKGEYGESPFMFILNTSTAENARMLCLQSLNLYEHLSLFNMDDLKESEIEKFIYVSFCEFPFSPSFSDIVSIKKDETNFKLSGNSINGKFETTSFREFLETVQFIKMQPLIFVSGRL